MKQSVRIKKKYIIVLLLGWLGTAFLLTLWPFNFTCNNFVTFPVEGGVHFTSPSVAYIRQLPAQLGNLKKFSIVTEVKPDYVSKNKGGVLFAYCYDHNHQNFLAMQSGRNLGFYLSDRNDAHHIWIKDFFEKDRSVLIAVTYDGENISFLKDGTIKEEVAAKDLDFSSWDSSYPLVFANTGIGTIPWSGTIYSMDIFDNAIAVSHSEQLNSIRHHAVPVLSLSIPNNHAELENQNNDNSTPSLLIPSVFYPPEKGLLTDIRYLFEGWDMDFVDFFLNILFFFPLGLLLRPLLERYTKRYALSFWLTILTGLCLTLIIESLQILLPDRNTSLIDIFANTLGTIAGSSLFTFSWIRRIFHLRSRGFMHNPQHWLRINTSSEIEKITKTIHYQVRTILRKKGAVIAISGGIDSSVCAALCTKALGKEHVIALSLPERDSSSDSTRLGQQLADVLGIKLYREDIEPTLKETKCYQLQIEAIRQVFPEYGEGWKQKITLPSILENDRLNLSHITVQSPDGAQKSARMPLNAYLQLIAATNLKQRTRKMREYLYADRFNYAVCGTPNRLEYDQGFFVKLGDGSADFKPIAHLYKTQVYQIAEALEIPKEIRNRPPTTETFSLPQTQEEFYFSLPFGQMDICLYGFNHNFSSTDVANATHLTSEQVERIYKDIEKKRRTTLALHLPPLLIESVGEISDLIQSAVKQSREV